MPHAFIHEARVQLDAHADERAPGGAITVELCGHWEHEGSCQWPHLTSVTKGDANNILDITVTFDAPVEDEGEIRSRIDKALAAGTLTGPDGRTSTWQLIAPPI